MSKPRSFTIRPGSSVRAQAATWNLLTKMAGLPELPTCGTCGGLTVETGPRRGRCDCPPPDMVEPDRITSALEDDRQRLRDMMGG